MKGYQNPNMASTLGLAACAITPLKAALAAYVCTFGPLAIL